MHGDLSHTIKIHEQLALQLLVRGRSNGPRSIVTNDGEKLLHSKFVIE